MDGRNRIYDRISQNYPDVSLQMLGIYCIFAISMTDEQIAAKKEHAGEKKASMKRRDDHHDYTERRMYMITLEVEQYLEEARQGVVLVSPAISPGEKRVMRAAFDAGLPTIVIMENGFTPLSKPHGEQFYACGQGTLLMLSPWEHHNEKRKLTAAQCTQMNLMALEICE
jgi:hypothetical protein